MQARRRRQFFYRLPVHKQLTLLKRLNTLDLNRTKMIKELARELNVCDNKLIGWISVMRNRSSVSRLSKLSMEVNGVLNDEFDLSEELSEDRARILGYVLNTKVPVIREWFERMRFSRKAVRPSGVPKKSPAGQDNAMVLTQRFTAKQYQILMAHFKQSTTLLDEEVSKLATRTGLQSAQVHLWFEIQKLQMRTSTMNKLLQNLSSNLCTTQLVELEKQFRKSVAISSSEATSLSDALNVKPSSVLLWFKRRRIYELHKIHGTYEAVDKEQQATRAILEASDLSAARAEFQNQSQSPLVSIPSCGLVGKKLTESPNHELTAGNSQTGSLDREESINQCNQENTPPGRLSPIVVQNILFEEFQKSYQLSAERISLLQKRLQISAYRIKDFFKKWSVRLKGINETSLTKQLTTHSNTFLVKVTAEYRQNRFISVIKSQRLSKQLETTRRNIDNWFINARLYELITGNQYTPHAVCEDIRMSCSALHLLGTSTSSDQFIPDARKSPAVGASGVSKSFGKWRKPITEPIQNQLKEEVAKNSEITDARLKALAQQHYVARDPLQHWSENNSPACFESSDKLRETEASIEISEPLTTSPNETAETEPADMNEISATDGSANESSTLKKVVSSMSPTTSDTYKSDHDAETKSIVNVRRSVRQKARNSVPTFSQEVVVLDVEPGESPDIAAVNASVFYAFSNSSDAPAKSHCDSSFCLCSTLGGSCVEALSKSKKKISFCEIDQVFPARRADTVVSSSGAVENDVLKRHADDVQIDTDDECSSPVAEDSQSSSGKNSAADNEKKGIKQQVEFKKKKFAFSALQRQILQKEFKKSPFVSASKARWLANDLNVPVRRIEQWFEVRRSLKLKSVDPQKEVKAKQDETKKSVVPQKAVNSERAETTISGDSQMVVNLKQEIDLSSTLSEYQLFVLRREFEQGSKLTKTKLDRICKKLRCNRRPVADWFKKKIPKKTENV